MRSTKIEQVKRINKAVKILKKYGAQAKVIKCLQKEYGVSRPQAYRYVIEAAKIEKALPIPEQKEVVTIKLPVKIINRVRRLGRVWRESISMIVTKSLGVYLRANGI